MCSVIGAAVVAVPDSGPRLFSISSAHGPSAVDLVGILVMLAGWSVFLWALWGARHLARRTGSRPLISCVAGIGLGLLVASVTDYPQWWVIGALLLVVAQLAFAYSVIRRGPRW